MGWIIKKISVFVAIALFVSSLRSQTLISNDAYILKSVKNMYWQSDTSAFVELETMFYVSRLTLVRDSVGLKGKSEIQIVISRKEKLSTIYNDRFVIPVLAKDSSVSEVSKAVVNKFTYVLDSGSYHIAVYGFDSTNRLRTDSMVYEVTVKEKPTTTVLSDIELCSNIEESTDKRDVFYKNTYRAIPNPSLVFGTTTSPVIFSYVELYNLSVGKPYLLRTKIVDLKGNILKERIYNRKFSIINSVDVATLNIASIPSGKYNYQIVLSDTSGREIARTERSLFLYNPQVQAVVAKASSVRISEFAGMTSDELALEFRQAQYVARNEDKITFTQLHDADAQRTFLAQFWTDVESGKRGIMDVTRAVYLQRVETANQRYKSFGQQGWHTDRGRVYIMYGEPDEVERFPSSSESKPYEIWHYNQIESSVQFVFIDRTGFGEYTLVNSTKRGELQDDNWQQYLR